jgi:hypothetical protein
MSQCVCSENQSRFQLRDLWIKLLWPCMDKSLCGHMFSYLGCTPQVELLCLKANAQLLPKVVVTIFYISTNEVLPFSQIHEPYQTSRHQSLRLSHPSGCWHLGLSFEFLSSPNGIEHL